MKRIIVLVLALSLILAGCSNVAPVIPENDNRGTPEATVAPTENNPDTNNNQTNPEASQTPAPNTDSNTNSNSDAAASPEEKQFNAAYDTVANKMKEAGKDVGDDMFALTDKVMESMKTSEVSDAMTKMQSAITAMGTSDAAESSKMSYDILKEIYDACETYKNLEEEKMVELVMKIAAISVYN